MEGLAHREWAHPISCSPATHSPLEMPVTALPTPHSSSSSLLPLCPSSLLPASARPLTGLSAASPSAPVPAHPPAWLSQSSGPASLTGTFLPEAPLTGCTSSTDHVPPAYSKAPSYATAGASPFPYTLGQVHTPILKSSNQGQRVHPPCHFGTEAAGECTEAALPQYNLGRVHVPVAKPPPKAPVPASAFTPLAAQGVAAQPACTTAGADVAQSTGTAPFYDLGRVHVPNPRAAPAGTRQVTAVPVTRVDPRLAGFLGGFQEVVSESPFEEPRGPPIELGKVHTPVIKQAPSRQLPQHTNPMRRERGASLPAIEESLGPGRCDCHSHFPSQCNGSFGGCGSTSRLEGNAQSSLPRRSLESSIAASDGSSSSSSPGSQEGGSPQGPSRDGISNSAGMSQPVSNGKKEWAPASVGSTVLELDQQQEEEEALCSCCSMPLGWVVGDSSGTQSLCARCAEHLNQPQVVGGNQPGIPSDKKTSEIAAHFELTGKVMRDGTFLEEAGSGQKVVPRVVSESSAQGDGGFPAQGAGFIKRSTSSTRLREGNGSFGATVLRVKEVAGAGKQLFKLQLMKHSLAELWKFLMTGKPGQGTFNPAYKAFNTGVTIP